jgi:hypothetical protein
MTRAVRNALMIGGLLALTWLLIVLAWRIAKWLFIVAVWVTALTVTGLTVTGLTVTGLTVTGLTVMGLTLLAQVVTQRFPPWIARLRGDQAQDPPRPPELLS